jgi:reversibly glycosylated polypeptide/UDP-arabinopyranose mutase
MTKKIAVVVPSIRPESLKKFMKAWQPLFDKHNVELLVVLDGKVPTVGAYRVEQVMGKFTDAISNFNGGVRNLGFALVAKHYPDIEVIMTFDDDEVPIGDPILDHLTALGMRVPISWFSIASEYTRGFPYAVRHEAEVVLSHGVWEGVADWDAPTQLVMGNRPITFYKGPIPKGIYYPMCGMNIAFKRKLLPYIYQAPKALGLGRTNDIMAGILSKREIDKRGWAVVSGYARVFHERASNVFKNLQEEAIEIGLYETFWQGDESHPYFKIYRKKLKLWQAFLKSCE